MMEVRNVIDGAEEVRERDLEYQKNVVRKWAVIQGLIGEDDNNNNHNHNSDEKDTTEKKQETI